MGLQYKELQKMSERFLPRQKEEERRVRAFLPSTTISSSDICLISETENSETSDFESNDKFAPIQLTICKNCLSINKEIALFAGKVMERHTSECSDDLVKQ